MATPNTSRNRGFPAFGEALISITQVDLREKWSLVDSSEQVGFIRHSKIVAATAKLEPMKAGAGKSPILILIKLLHTAAWLCFVACILGVPIAAALQQFRAAAIFSGLVLVECLILAINRCRCPLTNLAGAFTEERADNFDIYLPLWLARYNKLIFGPLFVAGEVFALVRWFRFR
jgi:hypothetical protein